MQYKIHPNLSLSLSMPTSPYIIWILLMEGILREMFFTGEKKKKIYKKGRLIIKGSLN